MEKILYYIFDIHGEVNFFLKAGKNEGETETFIMENIESSWNILMDINFKILKILQINIQK